VRYGKGRRQREVPLGKKARLALARYLRSHHAEAVFPSKGGASLTPNGLDQALYALYDRACRQHYQGLKLGAHVFRHTFAVRFLEAGGDVYRLSRIMGHSQITTTEGFLRAVTARQARQRSVSPLDSLGA
jgi:integrase/recombinase XerD